MVGDCRLIRRNLFSRRKGVLVCLPLIWGPPLLAGPFFLASAHYEKPPCAPDELETKVGGWDSVVCAPECLRHPALRKDIPCPADVPRGTTAKPECVLRDPITGKEYCGLVCQTNSDCPPMARCSELAVFMGICTYPTTNQAPSFRGIASNLTAFEKGDFHFSSVLELEASRTLQLPVRKPTMFSSEEGARKEKEPASLPNPAVPFRSDKEPLLV